MAPFLQLALWNANGLPTRRITENTSFSTKHDLMLISETHFTDKSYLRLPNYTVYHSNHPAGTARGSIKHHQLNTNSEGFTRATSVSVEDYTGPLTASAVYLPPKPTVKHEQLAAFYNTLGHRFIAGGDYNAKHTAWGTRLLSPRGREVLKTIEQLNLNHISSGEPTYWPSDCNKLPDLLVFYVTKGIPRDSALPTSCLDLSSDHSPVLITPSPSVLNQAPPPRLSNSITN
jgi:hypothetical protein